MVSTGDMELCELPNGSAEFAQGIRRNFRRAVSCLLLLANSTKAEADGSTDDREALMNSMIAEHTGEVRVRRHRDAPECDVVVAVRGQEMSLRCRDYNQAVRWARIECKSYKIADGFTVER